MADPKHVREALPPERPMYRGVKLPYRDKIPVLGITVDFRSNSPAVMAAVEQSFGRWRGAALRRAGKRRVLRVSIVEHEGSEGTGPWRRTTWRMPDDSRMIGFTRGSVGIADFERGEVDIYATAELVDDRDHFCFGIVEAFTLTALGTMDRSPLHAGAIARGDRVLLLVGPSGSGKSTLAYAAVQSGYQLISDDATYVQMRPSMRIWGAAQRVFLLPESRPLFPQLETARPQVLASGEEKLQVPVTAGAEMPVKPSGLVVVLLDRSRGVASAERVSASDVRRTLEHELEHTFALFPAMRRAIALIAGKGGWRLHLTRNPSDAIPFLDQITETLGSARRGRRSR